MPIYAKNTTRSSRNAVARNAVLKSGVGVNKAG